MVLSHAAFYTVVIKLTENDAEPQYALKETVSYMNLVLLSGETVLRGMFVVSHEARGASSKPVCELKCSSINFSTAYSPVKTMLCWSEMDGWRGGGAINPKYTNTSNEMSHCKGCRLIY